MKFEVDFEITKDDIITAIQEDLAYEIREGVRNAVRHAVANVLQENSDTLAKIVETEMTALLNKERKTAEDERAPVWPQR